MTLSGSSSDSSNPANRRRPRLVTPRSGYGGPTYEDYGSRSLNYVAQDPGPGVLNVFNDNLTEGIKKLREFSKKSSIVAIDTEFPGTVVKLTSDIIRTIDVYYKNVKMNTDILKPIQIGFSFFDRDGNPVDSQSTIQFNFQWNMTYDIGNQDSLSLLERSGIDFARLEKQGIDPDLFAELFITSGLVLNDQLTWVGFHSSHDWAYILKIVTGWPEMPEKFQDFEALLQLYFPKTIDLKTIAMMKRIYGCGLQDLSVMYHVPRYGAQHQAGSDSRLTGETYVKFINAHFEGQVMPEWYNQIFGLNYEYSPYGSDRSSPMSGGGGDATPDDDSNSNNDDVN